MNLLTELSSVLTEADDLIALTDIADEKEILNHDYSNIMDQAEDYLYIRKWEASSVKFRKIKGGKTAARWNTQRGNGAEKSSLCTKSEETRKSKRSTWIKTQNRAR